MSVLNNAMLNTFHISKILLYLMHTITLCKKHDLKINAILDHLHICVFQHDMRCLHWYPEKDTFVYVLINQVFIHDNK